MCKFILSRRILPDYHRKAADALRQPLSFISRNLVADVLSSRDRRALSVCFTGHRRIDADALPEVRQRLALVLDTLYHRGYRDYICGGALGFDTLAAEGIVQLKDKHPDVRLIVAIPCTSQSAPWHEEEHRQYERLLYLADEMHVLSRHYYTGCMQVRNRFMVDRSAMCICYLVSTHGGTMSTVSYALAQECPVLNLAVDTEYKAFTSA